MINQTLKSIYFNTVVKLSVFSFIIHKLLLPNRYRNSLLHLGSGPDYINGMVNIDGNIFAKKDMWLDLKLGLPFSDNSIKGIYTSHTLEHFKPKYVVALLKECYRVLQPGQTMRIIVPSLEYAISVFNEKSVSKFSDWPEKFDSIGGRFNNFILCANQHYLMFDFTLMEEMLRKAGFVEIHKVKPHNSEAFNQMYLTHEYSDDPLLDSSLYVECKKPK
jgi:predicted SAM-dependent methyltransferase